VGDFRVRYYVENSNMGTSLILLVVAEEVQLNTRP